MFAMRLVKTFLSLFSTLAVALLACTSESTPTPTANQFTLPPPAVKITNAALPPPALKISTATPDIITPTDRPIIIPTIKLTSTSSPRATQTYTPRPTLPIIVPTVTPHAAQPIIIPTVAPRPIVPTSTSAGYRSGARCKDGSHSNATGRGACSWHGGVSCWYNSDGTCSR